MSKLRKLRLNLTIVNTAVLIGLLIFCTVFIYLSLNMSSDSDIANSLEIYCAQLAGNLDYLEATDKNASQWDETRTSFQVFNDGLAKNNTSYVVWNEKMEVVDSSNQSIIEDAQLLNLIKRYASEHHDDYWVVNYQKEDQKAKICTYPVLTKNGELKTIQVIKNMNGEISSINNTLNMLILMVIIGGVISVVCGYLLSGHSLMPVEESMDRQQEFLANASHELRTPIAVIRTNLEVVQGDPEGTVKSQEEWLRNAYEETRRMQQIVEDLMFLARADAGEVHGMPEPVDMVFLSQEVIERMLPVAAQKQIMLDWDMPDHPLVIMGDESQLTQLLIIFIDNAIKHSNSGTEIRIIGELVGRQVNLRIKDQGIGIAPQDQDKIFNRFYRVDKARSRAEGGTGLGLSIAQWIVQKHKGVLSVESEEGNGTTMTVTFPLAEQTNGDDEHEGNAI